jgi:hypothetical protein
MNNIIQLASSADLLIIQTHIEAILLLPKVQQEELQITQIFYVYVYLSTECLFMPPRKAFLSGEIAFIKTFNNIRPFYLDKFSCMVRYCFRIYENQLELQRLNHGGIDPVNV